jgi:hypothetical protein
MTTVRQGLMVVLAVAAVGWVGAAGAGPTKAQVCEADKLTAAGKKEACLANERAKEVKGGTPDFAKCDAAFMKAFTKAETKAGPGICPTEGDAVAVEALIDACFDDLKAALSGSPNPPCVPGAAFPATGQTTCWNSVGSVIPCAGTGQDGGIQAGATLSYTDNGDGTITDNNTGLMWEKKSDDGSIHDKDTVYTWADAFAVHVAGLNAAAFAGHTDWRVPNVKELQSIVNYENSNPSVSPAFNTGCVASCTVATCSCTAAGFYWSSSTFAFVPTEAWVVGFFIGQVTTDSKNGTLFVRAVRGGS